MAALSGAELSRLLAGENPQGVTLSPAISLSNNQKAQLAAGTLDLTYLGPYITRAAPRAAPVAPAAPFGAGSSTRYSGPDTRYTGLTFEQMLAAQSDSFTWTGQAGREVAAAAAANPDIVAQAAAAAAVDNTRHAATVARSLAAVQAPPVPVRPPAIEATVASGAVPPTPQPLADLTRHDEGARCASRRCPVSGDVLGSGPGAGPVPVAQSGGNLSPTPAAVATPTAPTVPPALWIAAAAVALLLVVKR